MDWPTSAEYTETIQNLAHCMGDEELRAGEPTLNALGLPMLWSGGFANVYKIHNTKTKRTWALKCFTRKVTGQEDRYRHISEHLKRARLRFMVDFVYLNQGVRVRGQWFPALKMRWVEGGIRLNQFIEDNLDRPNTLRELLKLWPRMASQLRRAEIAHADLQHGNVLLVPKSNRRLVLRLIDYDGMHVPSLAGTPSTELGHPAFQHPQRSRERIYSAEVDRFSHLAIFTAIHCLAVGGRELWQRFNNGDNLLFRQKDFHDPASSEVFHTLWELPDADSRALAGRMALACKAPLAETPLLKDVTNGQVFPLSPREHDAATSILGSNVPAVPVAALEPIGAVSEDSRLNALLTAEELPPAEPMAPALRAAIRESEKPAPEPIDWDNISLIDLPLLFDRFLARISGDDNTVLHNFFRAMSVAGIILFVTLPLYALFKTTGSSPAQVESVTAVATSETTSLDTTTDSPRLTDEFTNKIGMRFKLIPAGEFLMGTPGSQPGVDNNESPQHRVKISTPFHMAVHEVTQGQFEKVMGRNPSEFKGTTRPVDNVSWDDAVEFCTKLSKMDTRFFCRLPTEAEWEYACRAGTTTPYSCGDRLTSLYAWSQDDGDAGTHPVGKLQPNAWGLYDMHGNVWEWCLDYYDAEYYVASPKTDPAGFATGSDRTVRGGGWADTNWTCRSAYRYKAASDKRSRYIGFRVVLVPTELELRVTYTPRPDKSAPKVTTSSVIAKRLSRSADYTNGIGMHFKLIPAGEFMMGSPDDAPIKSKIETPQHRVRITKNFYLAMTEVTQREWEQIMEGRPWERSTYTKVGPDYPASNIDWAEATEFCNRLSQKENRTYRLPTEAEWEYACRAGTTTSYSFGNDGADLDAYAWFRTNAEYAKEEYSHQMGRKLPNPWGLYDMHGNESEWCADWYDDDYYDDAPLEDPAGPDYGKYRACRGGSWAYFESDCRSASRDRASPTDGRGFRVLLEYPNPKRNPLIPPRNAVSADTAKE